MGCGGVKPAVLPTNIDCGSIPSIVLDCPETPLELAQAYNRVVDVAIKERNIIKCYEETLKKNGK
jgi:hypothetical protein